MRSRSTGLAIRRFSGQIGFLNHHASEQPVRHDRGGRAGGFHHADEDRSLDASGPRYRGLAAGTSSRAVSSMTAVPRSARASCRPSHGISHETARLAKPANVAKPTNGATIRFAGMENTGSSGSMSTWIGRVNTCAAMVMDRASATNRGRTGSIHALRVSANSTMPSTAAQDRANPKLCDMCGHAISIANVVQLNDAIAGGNVTPAADVVVESVVTDAPAAGAEAAAEA